MNSKSSAVSGVGEGGTSVAGTKEAADADTTGRVRPVEGDGCVDAICVTSTVPLGDEETIALHALKSSSETTIRAFIGPLWVKPQWDEPEDRDVAAPANADCAPG